MALKKVVVHNVLCSGHNYLPAAGCQVTGNVREKKSNKNMIVLLNTQCN